MAMSVAMGVLLILLGLAALAATAGTVVLVIRDGRGRIPLESPAQDWTAGTLPSRPYSLLRRI
ncbi:hypothetical protein [Pseudarthrobacter polychromogenes]|uniref:Uncharacterized protein n=1 Tax=Pseudarthrobacter polychromogenes TaxID=1676 RepID=A0ABQ1Y4D8_9MICC|nr:hypothetical protein [Pseudarthrobacter polychromogenes]MBD1594111.1 hypothetical protein [Arthrobacter sp. S1_S22]GGH11154.1 hypothetical protein GCM10011577_40310 [Pseudarthrobacter polychromogenes]